MKTQISETAKIYPNAIIGDGCFIGDFVVIHDDVVIGNNVKIYGPCAIGSPPEYKGHRTEAMIGGKVFIGDRTEIREFVTINAPLLGKTVVGNDCYIMAKSHIGHDSLVGNNCVLSSCSILGGHTQLGNNVNVGLNATTHQWSILNDFCMLGAQAFFKGESEKGIIWVGVPAKALKVNFIGIDRSDLSDHEKDVIKSNAISNLKFLLNSYE